MFGVMLIEHILPFLFISERWLFQVICVLIHGQLYVSLQVRLCSPPSPHMEDCFTNLPGKQFFGRHVSHQRFISCMMTVEMQSAFLYKKLHNGASDQLYHTAHEFSRKRLLSSILIISEVNEFFQFT
jgi:hypothetical protein